MDSHARAGLILWACLILHLPAGWRSTASAQPADHRYAPENYQTVICFPDDWHKTMVNERGDLSYDFGPGPYARPMTEISITTAGTGKFTASQSLGDPHIPVVTTMLHAESTAIRLTSFSLLPATMDPPPATPAWKDGRIRREFGMNGCIGWASPPDSIDPAFRNAAWGNNRPILYRVAVHPGSARTVAMGVCEPYKGRAGMRSLDLRVEGAPSQIVDPMVSGTRNTPAVVFFDGRDVDGDGWLRVECHAAGPDPNIFLNAFWVFPPGTPITASEVLEGKGSRNAEIFHRCGTELERVAPAPRADAIVAEILRASRAPRVIVRTRRMLDIARTEPAPGSASAGACLVTNDHHETGPQPYLFSRPRPVSMRRTDEGWILEYQPHTPRVEIVVVHGNHGPRQLRTFPDLRDGLAATRRFWQGWDPGRRIVVPDSTIQSVIDASVRTMYQVRERVDGFVQFQPGPSVYRGLWIADAMLTGIPVAMLGDTSSLLRYLETGMRYQLPNGQVRSLFPSVSIVETPAWAFAAFWVARATGDRSWLTKHWSEIGRALDWICTLRDQTISGPPTPYSGLLPAGFVDGGISVPMSDYGTLWWCMVALEEGVQASAHVGDPGRGALWQRTLEGFAASFPAAARRDLLKDRYGNPFLPVGVADTAVSTPQRGQLSVFAPARFASFVDSPGSLIDSLVGMNLTMMENYRCQGLYQSSGWLSNGIWPWLGGYLGLVHQRVGDPVRAAELLYAYADHAAPTGVWVEEQLPRDIGGGTTGDVSDAEASAVFIHLARYLLATERKDGLELLRGVPVQWLKPGAVVALRNTLSEFGPLSFELRLGPGSAVLSVDPINGRGSAGGPYVTTVPLRRAGFTLADGAPLPDRLAWNWGERYRVELRRETSR